MAKYPDIGVELSGHVATIEIQRPPNNFFDMVLINSIADALEDARQERSNAAPWCSPRRASRSAPARISATARR